jgi:hypothetical protein
VLCFTFLLVLFFFGYRYLFTKPLPLSLEQCFFVLWTLNCGRHGMAVCLLSRMLLPGGNFTVNLFAVSEPYPCALERSDDSE